MIRKACPGSPTRRRDGFPRRFSPTIFLGDTRKAFARQSTHVVDLRELAKFIRCRRAEAEKLDIGRNLLEQHVGADLVVAAFGPYRRQEWRDLLLHDDFADKGRR